MMRFFVMLVAVGLLAAGSYWLHERSQPVIRQSRPISHDRQTSLIHAPGVVEGVGRQLDLRLQVAGRISEVLVKEGSCVEAGAPLVKLDDATQRHQVTMLEGEVSQAQAQLERLKNGAHEQERLEARALRAARQAKLQHAQHELERAIRLVKTSALNEQEVDRWKADVNTQTAEVEAAQARLDFLLAPPREDELRAAEARVLIAEAKLLEAKTQLERTALYAPNAGQILEVNREPGELLDATDKQPVIVMADTSRLRVRAYVEELDAAGVRAGMSARITADGLPGRTFLGEVVEVMPRMSFKQVWTDRPDERFDVKTRELLIDVVSEETNVDTGLVYGLLVDVELLPPTPADHVQVRKVSR
jgi:HlyD family secretion protein